MAINDNGTRNNYTATALQTVFIYTFEIFVDADIAVEQNGNLLSPGADYTVSNVGNDNGGNVTLTVGATSGDSLVLYRDMAFERLDDYINNGDFLASDINGSFDRLWAALQQNKTNISTLSTSERFKLTLEGFLKTTNADLTTSSIVEFDGYAEPEDGGHATWKHNGVTGQTASQSPAQLGDGLLNDASGNQYEVVIEGGSLNAKALGCVLNAETLLDSATDDILTLRAAQKTMLKFGGGVVLLDGLAAVSDTLEINQRVIFKGSAKFFANQFTNDQVRPAGCGFYALSGVNADIIDIKLDVYDDSGTLRETLNDKELNDYRHYGGLQDLIVYGNRSNQANPPATVDKNTSGSGIKVSGARYPFINNVLSVMCAEDGLDVVSFDYGLGSNACNNHRFNSITVLNNAKNGASLSGGDGRCIDINAGYNGINGVSSTLGASRISGECWNNQQDGLNISGGDRSSYDFLCYDQKRQGFRITNTEGCVVKGVANANGRDTGLGASNRAGVLTGNSNELLRLDIVSNGQKDVTSYQAYGFNISNASNEVCVAGCFAGNNFTADWLITTPANIIKDTNAP